MNLEQIIQIISILAFVATAVIFFIKTGAYKNTVEKDIITLQEDVQENKTNINQLKKEVDDIKTNNAQVTIRLETLLIELKTKLDLLMQFSGLVKKNKNE